MARVVLNYGMIKSASTFVHQVTRDLIEETTESGSDCAILKPQDVDAALGESDFVPGTLNLKDVLANAVEATNRAPGSWVVLKTHSRATREIMDIVEKHGIFVQCTFRHPADVACSLRDAAESDRQGNRDRFDRYDSWDKVVGQIPHQIDCLMSWTALAAAHFISFDAVAARPDKVASDIAGYLGLGTSGGHVVSRYVSGEKKIGEFNTGKIGRSSDELTAGEVARIEALHKSGSQWIVENLNRGRSI